LQETLTRFAHGIPRPEYPRPRLVRGGETDWICLNGVWEFTFDNFDSGLYDRWQEKTLADFILVPFAPQWDLSCKAERETYEIAWYARDFEIPASWLGGDGKPDPDRDVLLHFGACDYRTTVWINGVEARHNIGGHVPFSVDVSPHLQAGVNRVALRVEDKQDPRQPRGKQAARGRPTECDYWNTTGIWQSVWLESAPAVRIEDVVLTPHCAADAQKDSLEITAYLHAPASGWRVEFEVFDGLLEGGAAPPLLARNEIETTGAVARVVLPLPNAPRWSPDNPRLLGVRVRLFAGGSEALDEVRSYSGLRNAIVKEGRFHLNGEPLYLRMVLDQGYWPDGGMTAPTDGALQDDIAWCKKLGFNGVRKHQKVEDPRWLLPLRQSRLTGVERDGKRPRLEPRIRRKVHRGMGARGASRRVASLHRGVGATQRKLGRARLGQRPSRAIRFC
jgi:beta-galactosidase/beta-glucuronidase